MSPAHIAVFVLATTVSFANTSEVTDLPNVGKETPYVAASHTVEPLNGSKSKVIGRLGQTTLPTKIYAASDIGSRVYFEAEVGRYLVLVPSKSALWWKVLLQNGNYGYIAADSVNAMSYQVVQDDSALSQKDPVAYSAARSIGDPLGTGIDSGVYVQKLYAMVGIRLPSKPDKQALIGKAVNSLEDLREGDRVYFWGSRAGKIDRVGIFVGNGYFVMANTKSSKVESYYLGDKKWLKLLVASRR